MGIPDDRKWQPLHESPCPWISVLSRRSQSRIRVTGFPKPSGEIVFEVCYRRCAADQWKRMAVTLPLGFCLMRVLAGLREKVSRNAGLSGFQQSLEDKRVRYQPNSRRIESGGKN
jgi:hypothetical protein